MDQPLYIIDLQFVDIEISSATATHSAKYALWHHHSVVRVEVITRTRKHKLFSFARYGATSQTWAPE